MLDPISRMRLSASSNGRFYHVFTFFSAVVLSWLICLGKPWIFCKKLYPDVFSWLQGGSKHPPFEGSLPPTQSTNPSHKLSWVGQLTRKESALTVSKYENFHPYLALKFDSLILITHFISFWGISKMHLIMFFLRLCKTDIRPFCDKAAAVRRIWGF